MSDYSFMRSGIGGPSENSNEDFHMKLMCLLKILVEKSIEIAADYCEHAKRDTVTGMDMVYALKYQAHEFLTADTESELATKLHEYLNDADTSSLLLFAPNSDNESESDTESASADSGTEEGESTASEGEASSNDDLSEADTEVESDDDAEFTESTCQCAMCTKINMYNREWDEWQPSEEMHIIFKNAVNRAHSTLT